MDWIELEQPLWLLLGLLVIPVVWLGRRSMSGLGRWRQYSAIALRALIVACGSPGPWFTRALLFTILNWAATVFRSVASAWPGNFSSATA